MLLSEQKERGRKFKLALRAGIPVLLLIGLVAYSTLFRNETIDLGLKETMLAVSIIFVTIYFIFFLLEEDGQKTLLDHATNSYNYQAFLDQYKSSRPQTLALIVINNLRTVNENYGMYAVESMLRSLVYQLDATLAAYGVKSAIIGRKYGAEFIIGSDSDKEKMLEAIGLFIADHTSVQEIELDYRLGVTSNTKSDLDKTIWHLQDIAMRSSKGTNIRQAEEVEDLDGEIAKAIESKSVLFSFRPLYSVKGKIIDGYEISSKLKLKGNKTLLPRVYLPVVNRLGLGREYDIAVLGHVLKLLPLIDEKVSFSFNLSPFSLRDQDFRKRVFAMIDDSGIDSSRLVIELYERKTHHNLEGYLRTLSSFRDRGVRICIDNFGSSSASMEYMRHFKFDMVQFDRDYVGNLKDPNSMAMLKSFIEMSKGMRITTVAKWVDNDEQKQQLIDMGIDYLQGFGIAKPISEEKLINTYN